MDDEKKKDYVLLHRKEDKDYTKDRRDAWQELWRLYQNKQDYKNKKDWQSRVFIPKLFMTITQASSMVKRAITSTKQLFSLETKHEKDEFAERHRKDTEKKMRRHLDESNFVKAYDPHTTAAMLLGLGAIKVLWQDGRLHFTNTDVQNLYIDPAYEPFQGDGPNHIIEDTKMDLEVFKARARSINKKAGRKIYDTSVIAKIEADFQKQEEDMKRKARLGAKDYTPPDRKIWVTTFWGDVIDKDSGKIEYDRLVQIANDTYLIRDQENPFIHKKSPFILTYPLVYPHRGACGISLVEPMIPLQYAYNNVTNMAIDNLNWSVNKLFEVHCGNIMNARNLTDIYPGKMVKKHGPQSAIEEVRTSNIGQDAFNVLNLVNTEIEKGTAVTEFIMGISGKNKTATEAQLKTAQAQGVFDVIARSIEKNSLEPLFYMVLDLLIQFGKVDPQLKGRYKINVGGISLLLSQQEQKQSLGQVLMMALKSPTLGQMTNVRDGWRKWLDLHSLSELFSEQGQAPSGEQRDLMRQKAAQDAKEKVKNMTPDEIMKFPIQKRGKKNEEVREPKRKTKTKQSGKVRAG